MSDLICLSRAERRSPSPSIDPFSSRVGRVRIAASVSPTSSLIPPLRSDIGRIIYGSPETALLALTGDHPENPTMSLSCRTVLRSGSKDVQVIGPVPEMEEKVLKSHRDFWASR